jgi:hypothetical protein
MDKTIQLDLKNLFTIDKTMEMSFQLMSILKSNLKKSDMKRLIEIEKYTLELLKLKNMNRK